MLGGRWPRASLPVTRVHTGQQCNVTGAIVTREAKPTAKNRAAAVPQCDLVR